jgi:excisionase family DNA binding protein
MPESLPESPSISAHVSAAGKKKKRRRRGRPPVDPSSPWLTAWDASRRARVGLKTIYSAVRANRLRVARVGGRREYRFLASWVDAWLEETAKPIETSRGPIRGVVR